MRLDREQEIALQQLLTAELRCAQEFKTLLDREFKALKGQDSELIRSTSKEKQSLTIQMQQYLQARNRLLSQLAMPTGNEGTKKLLEQNPASVCSPLWQQLIELGHGLREQNEINGGVIIMGQRHAKQALEILSGKTHDKNTYSRKGEAMLGSSVHTLAKA